MDSKKISTILVIATICLVIVFGGVVLYWLSIEEPVTPSVVENTTVSQTTLIPVVIDGDYQASINITDSLLSELELYSEGITEGFEGEVLANINLTIDDSTFTLSIDDYETVMAKFDYIEANGNTMVKNLYDLWGLDPEALDDYAEENDYESYEDMITSTVLSIEGSIGNGTYVTRTITGTYDIEGNDITFHTEDGVIISTYCEGIIFMELVIDGQSEELEFNLSI